jgi:hypothetical protein
MGFLRSIFGLSPKSEAPANEPAASGSAAASACDVTLVVPGMY